MPTIYLWRETWERRTEQRWDAFQGSDDEFKKWSEAAIGDFVIFQARMMRLAEKIKKESNASREFKG